MRCTRRREILMKVIKSVLAGLLVLGTAGYLSNFMYYTVVIDSGCSKTDSNGCLVELRCGSSFFGKMFNFDPDTFYVFEPLDGLYSSMYGTSQGWNVPSDIVSYKDGSLREIPKHETNAIQEFLQNLFRCQVDSLPTQWLTHSFWKIFQNHQTNTGNYSTCLLPVVMSESCNLHLRQICPIQFNAAVPALEQCRQILSNNRTATSVVWPARRMRHISNYNSCVERKRRLIKTGKCLQRLRTSCADRRLRVVKLVRGTMESMQPLLEANPQLYVVHLVRDPRAVTLSRRKFSESGQGLYSRSTSDRSEKMIREATIYCRQVARDVEVRRKLERMFPGRLFSANYESVVDDPVGAVGEIYRFFGQAVPDSVVHKFDRLALEGNRNVSGKLLTTLWKRQVTPQLRAKIDERCAEMLQHYPQYTTVA